MIVTNSFLENYNGYIKKKFGKNRIINWMNFLAFLKDESEKIINKLYLSNSSNLKDKPFNDQINIINPFLKFKMVVNINQESTKINNNTKGKNNNDILFIKQQHMKILTQTKIG